MLDNLLHKTERMSRVAVWVAGGMLILSAVMVSVDVILRKLFAFSFGGADEIMGYVFAIGTAWAFTFTLLDRANVRIDALYRLLPAQLRAILDVVAILVLTVFIFFVTKGAWSVFHGSLGWPFGDTDFWSVSITPLLTPLAIPQGLWLLGLALFLFTLVLISLRSLSALIQGDFAAVGSVAGPRTHEEEVEEDLQLAGAADSAPAESAERSAGGPEEGA